MEGTSYFNYLREDGDFDIARAGWIGDYSDPQNFLFLHESGNLGSTTPAGRTPTTTQKMRAAAETTDLDARAELLARPRSSTWRRCRRSRSSIYSSRALVSDKLAGWEDNILNVHGTRWMSLTE